jgi:hypothetical protein
MRTTEPFNFSNREILDMYMDQFKQQYENVRGKGLFEGSVS